MRGSVKYAISFGIAAVLVLGPTSIALADASQSVGVTINSLARNASGSLDYNLTVYAAGHRMPGGVCPFGPYDYGYCTLSLQVTYASDQSVHSIQNQNLDIKQLGDPMSTTLTGTTSVPTISAIRVMVWGTWGAASGPATFYGQWVPVSENVQGGHDVNSALDMLVGALGSSAFPCVELFPVGTHQQGSSVNDQQLGCLAEMSAGKTFRQFLVDYVQSAGPKALTSMLVNAGISQSKTIAQLFLQADYGFPLPAGCAWTGLMSFQCGTTVVRPPSAPPRQDPVWENNWKAKAQTQRNASQQPAPTIPAPLPGATPGPLDNASVGDIDIALGEQCQADLAKWGPAAGLSDNACDTMPIFGTGSQSLQATQHDLDAITANPVWMKLTYVKGAEKLGSRGNWSATPPCDSMATGYQCDEYPFFSTDEGFPAQIPDLRPIPGVTDNQVQGGNLSNFYRNCPVLQTSARSSPGRQFLVIPMPFPVPTVTYCPTT